MTAAETAHGGDVERVARENGLVAERILDFSANVNPLGLPLRARERLARDASDWRALARYPDPAATALRRALSGRLHVPVESIVVGAGADALIHAAVRALAPKRCVIPVPAFAEYERACRAFGCAVQTIPLQADEGLVLRAESLRVAQLGDVVVLNNPHNPTGACLSGATMQEHIRVIQSAGAAVLVDEAFIDYLPDASITHIAASMPSVIVIRSLTKFFGCPGLRAGYAVAAPETARMLAEQLPAWPVTALALDSLTEAFGDAEYCRVTLESNEKARANLVSGLARFGCRVFPPSANFIFFEVPKAMDALEIRSRLIREHAILVRECDSFRGLERGRYLRIAVRTESENQRLLDALAAVLTETSWTQRA
jgi:threonine-phosphate decarboxylase